MTVSYLTLIKVQQKRHGFPVRDRAFTSSVDLLAAGKAARGRLMGAVEIAKPKVVVLAPPSPPKPAPDAVSRPRPRTAPINMLRRPAAKFLLRLIVLKHKISAETILGPSRKKDVVIARSEAMCLIYQHTQWSLPQVGRFMNRDHTTVLYALRKGGVERKQVEMIPHMAAALRPKVSPRGLAERQPRDVIVIPQSAAFITDSVMPAQQIIDEVCEHYGVSELELRSHRRAEHLVVARHEAMYRLSKETALTSREIGKAMGGRDRSLVNYAVNAHKARMEARQ